MGRTNRPEAGVLLQRTAGRVLKEPSTVLRWPGADRNVSHRGTRQPHDHGVAEVLPWIASLLYLRRWWWNPPVSRCRRGNASGARLRAASPSDPRGGGIPVTVSPLRRAFGVPHGRLYQRREFR